MPANIILEEKLAQELVKRKSEMPLGDALKRNFPREEKGKENTEIPKKKLISEG